MAEKTTENQQSNQPPAINNKKTPAFIDEDKNTQLHYVAAQGNLEDVKREIEENSSDVDPLNYLGWTPLMMATRYGHLAVIEYLIEKRADSTRKNKFGFNILLLAVASGKLDVLHFILQHLLRGGVSRQVMQNFFSPISLAVLFSNASMVQYLIEKKFCVNAECIIGIKPIALANGIRNTEIINMLMYKGQKAPTPTVPNENIPMQSNNPNNNGNNNVLPPKHMSTRPLILFPQHPNRLSPYTSFVSYTPTMQMPRRCSGMMSPCFSPNISPFPGYVQQVFFPPNFSPGHFVSPSPASPHMPYPPNNEFLNVGFMQLSPQYSPMPPIPVNVPCNVPYRN